ncbi:hypothetical protein GmHk_15G044149 [Glycine max]|nr:hypothetical protein GmHk_15G044149 [Glycine max]
MEGYVSLLGNSTEHDNWIELERQRWHKALTRQSDNHIDVALVKKFYANLYDPEDKSPRQCRVRGKLIKFGVATLNEFLETPVVLEPGERYSTYSKFYHTHSDPQKLASKLCILGQGFVLNTEGAPWKLLRKDLITLAQTWSVLSYSNLAPTSHTLNLNMDKARLIYGLVMKMGMDVGSIMSITKGSLHDLAQQRPIISMEDFMAQVAWPGVQPSFAGGAEDPTTQEPQPEPEAEETPEDTPIAMPMEVTNEGDGTVDTDYIANIIAAQST